MAIYHLSVKPMSRKGGRSATAAIAYRSAEKIHDLTSDQVFDYTRKRGVEHTEIVLPTAMAKLDVNWARDRQALWNAAEMAEKRKDARVAREYEVALPHELKAEQRVALVRAFAAELSNRYGVAVDFAIHGPHRNGDERNHHAHIMTTTREITATGLGRKTDIELGDRDRAKKGLAAASVEIESIRERWAVLTNAHLQAQQLEVRVDHRSLQAQGIEREPTSHLGPAVSSMERRGMYTEVGMRLEVERAEATQEKREIAAELVAVKAEQQALRVSLLELAAMAPKQRERKVKTPERTADNPLTRSVQRLAEPLKELGPEFKAHDPKPAARAWPLGQAPESARPAATRDPAPRRDEAAREKERLASLSARELWAQIQKINPPSVAHLVERDPSVVGARQAVESQQLNAAQALEAANRAARDTQAWRHEHGMQAKLHDLGVLQAAYLVERAAVGTAAKRTRAEALKALKPAEAQLGAARREADRRITEETAPARAQVAELKQLAREADERERVVKEFDRLARDRAARQMGFEDGSQDWQATPKELREAIDRYNRARPEVQREILKQLAVRPDKVRVLEQAIQVRHAQVHDRDYGLGL